MVIYKRRFSCPCKESACSVGDLDSIPGLGRSPGEGKGYPLQYSGLENSMNSIVHGVTKSRTQLSNFHFHYSVSKWCTRKSFNSIYALLCYHWGKSGCKNYYVPRFVSDKLCSWYLVVATWVWTFQLVPGWLIKQIWSH